MASKTVMIVLLSLSSVMLLATVGMTYLSVSELGRQLGLFSNNSNIPWNQRGNLNDSSLTPPSWAFSIWGAIYLYQLAAFVYCWSLVFRTSSSGVPLCCLPGLLPPAFLVCHAVSSCFSIAWVLLADKVDADKPLLVPQTIAIFGLGVALWVALAFSCQRLRAAGQALVREGLQREYWLVCGLVQNACGLYVGWVTVASFLNLDIAILNLTNVGLDGSATLCLAELGVATAAYLLADFIFLQENLRFLFTPYVSALWALVASLTRNFSPEMASSALSLQLAIAIALVLPVKALLAVGRQRRQPLPREYSSVQQEGSGFSFSKLRFA